MRKGKNNGIVIELCGIPLKKERKSGDGSGLKETEQRNILNGVKILYKKLYNRKI